jgi:hypothetical protein
VKLAHLTCSVPIKEAKKYMECVTEVHERGLKLYRVRIGITR